MKHKNVWGVGGGNWLNQRVKCRNSLLLLRANRTILLSSRKVSEVIALG